jgi:hypothetical protein
VKFEISYPSGAKNEVELEGTSALLGRDPGCDLVLNDVKCSRRHAIIEAGPDGMLIRDNGSANGIYVNGKKVDSAELSEGDQIRLGQILVTVLEENVPATVAMDAMEFADIEETGPLPTGAPPRPGGAETSDTRSLPPQAPPLPDAAALEADDEGTRPSSAVRGSATPSGGRPSEPPRAPTPPPRSPDPPPVRLAPPPPAISTTRPRAGPPRQHAPPAPQAASRSPRPPAPRARRPSPLPGALIELPLTLKLLVALWMLGALIYAGTGIGMGFFSGLSGAATVVVALSGIAMAAVAAGVAWGLWTLRPWARIAQIVLAGLGFLSCVGTLPSVAILVYMLRPEIPVLFSGARDRRQLDDKQVAILDAAGSDTLFAVGILVALVVNGLVALGLAWGAYLYLDAAGPGGPLAGS